MALPIFANISLASLRKLMGLFGLIDARAEKALANSYRDRLSIRSPDVAIEVGKLSGGNQQKVMPVSYTHLDVENSQVRVILQPRPGSG